MRESSHIGAKGNFHQEEVHERCLRWEEISWCVRASRVKSKVCGLVKVQWKGQSGQRLCRAYWPRSGVWVLSRQLWKASKMFQVEEWFDPLNNCKIHSPQGQLLKEQSETQKRTSWLRAVGTRACSKQDLPALGLRKPAFTCLKWSKRDGCSLGRAGPGLYN